jgi:hypothetical protein
MLKENRMQKNKIPALRGLFGTTFLIPGGKGGTLHEGKISTISH